MYSSAAEAGMEGMLVRRMLPRSVRRQRQKRTGVLATAAFAAARTASVVAVRGVERSIMSWQLTLVKPGEK